MYCSAMDRVRTPVYVPSTTMDRSVYRRRRYFPLDFHLMRHYFAASPHSMSQTQLMANAYVEANLRHGRQQKALVVSQLHRHCLWTIATDRRYLVVPRVALECSTDRRLEQRWKLMLRPTKCPADPLNDFAADRVSDRLMFSFGEQKSEVSDAQFILNNEQKQLT